MRGCVNVFITCSDILILLCREDNKKYAVTEPVLILSLAGCADQGLHTDYEDVSCSYSAVYALEDNSNFWMAAEKGGIRHKVI